MQRFTLIHDGSDQGWQAAYLAFHIAAQLGAPLLALLFDSSGNQDALADRAAQVETGGRAAGVSMGTHLIADLSLETLVEKNAGSNGLFIPGRLLPGEEATLRLLETISCPLWIVSKEAQMNGAAVLVSDPAGNAAMLNYAAGLSLRIQQTLTGLIPAGALERVQQTNPSIPWRPLVDLSRQEVAEAMDQSGASLLFLPGTSFSLVDELSINCVVYHTGQG